MSTSVALDYVRGNISVTAYWAAVSADMSFAEFCCACNDWEVRLIDSVNAAFWRLHGLDRASPFWKGTNGLATESKLSDFAAHELAHDSKSVEAAFFTIAMHLRNGTSHLELLPWRVLIEANTVDLRFLVCSAFGASPYWSDENVGRLANLVRQLNLHEEVDADFQWFATKGALEAEWVGSVRNALAA